MNNTEYTVYNTGRVTSLADPIAEPTLLQRVFQVGVAVIFIVAMLYFSGIYQFTRFQQTGSDVAVGTYQSLVSGEVRTVPANIYVLSSRETSAGQETIASSSETLVGKANEILTQAAVSIDVDAVRKITATSSPTGPELVSSNSKLRALLPELAEGELSIVLTRGLAGINGVAFGGTDVVAVAEYTTSFDFRVLAHEVGHVLGEGHVQTRANLMSSGGTGTELTRQQAERMYSAAARFMSQ